MASNYKFENFKNPHFPVYSSSQAGTGTLVVPHFHSAAELVRISRRNVWVYLNTQKLFCKQGDILYIPPFCIHSITSEYPDTLLQGFVFDFSLISSDSCGTTPQSILNQDKITRFVIDGSCDVYCGLDSSLSEGIRIYREDSFAYEFDMMSVLYKLTAMLLRHYHTSETASNRFRRLQPAIEYIREHYPQSITVSDLSSILHVCDDHLIRLFKVATNKTPANYITDIRLEEAMKLLVDTDLSVTEVAALCGFANSCYMARVFKSRLHATPLEYRRKRSVGI